MAMEARLFCKRADRGIAFGSVLDRLASGDFPYVSQQLVGVLFASEYEHSQLAKLAELSADIQHAGIPAGLPSPLSQAHPRPSIASMDVGAAHLDGIYVFLGRHC